MKSLRPSRSAAALHLHSCLLLLSLYLYIIPSTVAAPVLKPIIKRQSVSNGPVIPSDFADPSLLNVDGTWYSFATSTRRDGVGYRIQAAASFDFQTWSVSNKDAMAFMPAWVNTTSPQFWAPDVSLVDDGSLVMYYSARASGNGHHCVGAAVSPSIDQPFNPLPNPMFCPVEQGGAIDAAGFKDQDGSRYVVYKVDGNSLGHGGSCDNFIGPIVPTPILLQKVDGDGITLTNDAPVQLIGRDDSDGPLVEAPSLMHRDGMYYLFYSSNCYSSTKYDVAWAVAPSITGPYTKISALFKTGTDGLTSPGGASVAADGVHMVFHARNGNHRSLFTAQVSVSGKNVHS